MYFLKTGKQDPISDSWKAILNRYKGFCKTMTPSSFITECIRELLFFTGRGALCFFLGGAKIFWGGLRGGGQNFFKWLKGGTNFFWGGAKVGGKFFQSNFSTPLKSLIRF